MRSEDPKILESEFHKRLNEILKSDYEKMRMLTSILSMNLVMATYLANIFRNPKNLPDSLNFAIAASLANMKSLFSDDYINMEKIYYPCLEFLDEQEETATTKDIEKILKEMYNKICNEEKNSFA